MTADEFADRAKILSAKLLMERYRLMDIDAIYHRLYGIYDSIGNEYYIAHFASNDFPEIIIAIWENGRLTAGLYELRRTMEERR